MELILAGNLDSGFFNFWIELEKKCHGVETDILYVFVVVLIV